MDKEWTKLARFSKEYINGVESFLDFAYTKGRPQGYEILCPCAKCKNQCWVKRNVVYDHLIAKGFLKGYDVWVHHGEPIPLLMETDDDKEDQQDSHDDIEGPLYDTFRNVAEAEGITEGPIQNVKQPMTCWRNRTIRNISKKIVNRAKQKYMHRMRLTNFARIHAQLHAKENEEEVTQAEMFIKTWQSRKRKEVNEETQNPIAKLQDSVQNTSKSVGQIFPSLFSKEKPGRVCCFGRTATPSMLQRNEEIAALRKQHSYEMTILKKKIEGLEALIKCLLKQNNAYLDEETLDNIMGTAFSYENSVASCSSASSRVSHQYDEV